MRARVATAIAGLVASVLLSVVAWVYFDLPAFLVFLPFVPFLFRRGSDADTTGYNFVEYFDTTGCRKSPRDYSRQYESPSVRECPVCDFRTRDPNYEYCPRDGERLK
jgi:hypothetical protein